MCLIIWAQNMHPDYKLMLLANRDEFYERSALPAHFWENGLLAGKDLQAGGTWLGLQPKKGLAAVTNYRDPKLIKEKAPSRGELPLQYLTSSQSSLNYLVRLHPRAAAYNGFNLLLFDGRDVMYYSNIERIIKKADEGIHGLSNALLDTPWPKVRRCKQALKQYIEQLEAQPPAADDLFGIMQDTWHPPDEELPHTGVPLEWERALASPFIRTPRYGTRLTTIILWDKHDRVAFIEKWHATPFQEERIQRFELQMRLLE
ncbi:NRDE family protein [Thermonema sp.]|uniref:NRDE family protein n=1 Tax=Thermonema sp. TaxID=2231181 RepID=UPI002586E3F9|nr:NRDE family protein [Thermonema sp.]